jgi:hypothetical protein
VPRLHGQGLRGVRALSCSPSFAMGSLGSVLTDIMLFNFHTPSAELADSPLNDCAHVCARAVAGSLGAALSPRVPNIAWCAHGQRVHAWPLLRVVSGHSTTLGVQRRCNKVQECFSTAIGMFADVVGDLVGGVGLLSVRLQSFLMTKATTHQTLRELAQRAACNGAQQTFILMSMRLTKASAKVTK